MHPGEFSGALRNDRVQHPELGADRDKTARVVHFRKHAVLVGNAIIVRIDQADDAAFPGAFSERTE